MSARTGWKQAQAACMRVGCWPHKTENCPKAGSNSYQFLVALRGMSGDQVETQDIQYLADTLTEIRDWADRKWNERDVPVGEPGKKQLLGRDPIRAAEDGCVVPGSILPVGPTPNYDARVLGNAEGRVGQAVSAAIQAALEGFKPEAPSLDEDAIRELIRIETQTAIQALDGTRTRKVEITIPEQGTIETDGEHVAFPDLVAELALGHACMLSGPSGSGKTTACERAAKALGLEYMIQPPPDDRFEVTGFVDAGGSYQDSPSYRWATTPGAVLILDEMDRSNPRTLTTIHTLLGNGLAVFPKGQVSVPPENRILATANTWGIGPSAEYTGSARLDAATLNRFVSRLWWNYDEDLERRMVAQAGGSDVHAKEGQAIRKTIAARGIKIIWGPRDTVAYARRLAAGIARPAALARSVLATLSESDRDLVLGDAGVHF